MFAWWLMSAVWAATLPGSSRAVVVPADDEAALEAALDALDDARFDTALTALSTVDGPDARALAAAAAYELGDLRVAEREARAAVALEAGHAPALLLLGLTLADAGRGDEALTTLDAARVAAERAGDAEMAARAWLDRGVVRADRGETALAVSDWTRAATDARSAGFADVAAQADTLLRSVSSASGGDLVGQVVDRARRGDLAGAASLLPSVTTSVREAVHASIARGLVARLEGRAAASIAYLNDAVDRSDRAGMVREGLAARLELAQSLLAAGSPEGARETLEAALGRVAGTSFVVREVELRLALARVAVRTSSTDVAVRELGRAQASAARVSHPMLPAQLGEAAALVKGSAGDLPGAVRAAEAAESAWAALGARTDVARVACERLRLVAWSGAGVEEARIHAVQAFATAGDPRGPFHVATCEGIGAAAGARWDLALDAFARAEVAARALGVDELVTLSRANASEALRATGHDPAAVTHAQQVGFGDLVERHRRWQAARGVYETARTAFDARRYPEALRGFEAAYRELDALHELDDARRAQAGVAWSRYNLAVVADDASALAALDVVVTDAVATGEAELALRARAARAVALARLGRPGAVDAALDVVRAGTAVGRQDLVALAWTAKAQVATLPLAERAAAARAALAAARVESSARAMYDVAYAAYQDDDLALAVALCDEVLPHAGRLAPGVGELAAAAREALGTDGG